ncbi:hypothetical protein Vafri_6719 [Volvox africanus]|nr:hypothetical protein Vafri_6719 [Volvox africanus]
MDSHPPVGSLDIWLLDCPTSTAAPTAPSSAIDGLRECGKGVSAPVPIPRQHNAHAASTLGCPNPETRSGCIAPWEVKRSWLGEEDVRPEANLSNDLVWEGTVRRCRHLDVQSRFGPRVSVPLALRDPHCKRRRDGVTSTAASLPPFTAIEVSPVSLASLCRALSSPSQHSGDKTLAFSETDSVACVPGLDRPPTCQYSVLPTPSSATIRSTSEATPALGGPNSLTTSSANRLPDWPTRAVSEGTCPADCLVAFRAESASAVCNRAAAATAAHDLAELPAVASARANFLHHAGLSTKRGLYEGTVRGASMRNTWQYAGCCTAAG